MGIKNIFVLILLMAILIMSFTISEADEPTIKITVHLGEEFAREPQWVYWFSLYGNEYNIEDSLYLQEGQTLFTFEAGLNEEENYLMFLTFAKNGPGQAVIRAMRGEQITVYIDENTKPIYPRVEGSRASEETYRNRTHIAVMNDSVECLKDSILSLKDEEQIQELEQRIEKYKQYINKDSYLEFFTKANNPVTAMSMFSQISDVFPYEQMLDSLILDMKERFPESETIRLLPERKPYPPASERSKWAHARFEQLLDARSPNSLSTAEKEPTIDKKILEQIKPYQLGDKVDSISVMGLTGGQIPLDEIKTEYVLIDFWASWCRPCRKEIPYLKEVAEKYPHLVTIYAISLDNSEKEWKETIWIDKSEIFTHVYSGQITSNASVLLLARFGVKEIPANFLLDKNRKIIATGLREDALMKKMEELVQD